MLVGKAAIFHIIGVIAILRAVPHALMNHDRALSSQHEVVISHWMRATSAWRDIPALAFLKRARDLVLKGADFEGYAIHSESGIGEDQNRRITDEVYELSYYLDGERRDLEADIQSAIKWLDAELTGIESQLPDRHVSDPDDDWDFSDVLPDAAEETGDSS
jgi:hypothetical protein